MAGLESGAIGAMWQRMRLGWDVMNNGWNQWVLGYGPTHQNEFLSRFGLDSWKRMTVGMMFALVALLLAGGLILLYFRRRVTDPVAAQYRRFCRLLARRGILRTPTEGPIAFADRIAALRPDIALQSRNISALYAGLRYGPDGCAEMLRQLRAEVRAFRP
jgi:hypothetical protein